MIGILGGMGTQAGLDFCNKLTILNRGKIDQKYPLFILYNKSNIPPRPEAINISDKNKNKKYKIVLKTLMGKIPKFRKGSEVKYIKKFFEDNKFV